ncbi:type IVB secretion system protein IcmH/DotU [Serratia sp. UGAL515B_01]|jgi:type VI secretion system protein ImpK|uniref:type IVB secretion system protein IcmH/DotU n=1 Tax=Serratia sp. UGAL515B_01 TaxID=2986763 RepID=UPI002952B3BA|nr:type IVB secretion system protein IcmH/DotU [Serratia sp. UGAL515B_01]WON77466.1 type IVB secretion system protein IcmH/DotU [Serratia sp. UGAL515B_01]
MNDFERQIREAIAAARNGARHAEQSLTTPIWQAKSSMASLGGILPGSNGSPISPHIDEEQGHSTEPGNQPSEQALTSNVYPSANRVARVKSSRIKERPGVLFGTWDNPYIAAAMPLLLLVERFRGCSEINIAEIRPSIVHEIQYFTQGLQRKNCPVEEVSHLSYLCCTYIDGIFTNLQTSGSFSQSLLVEFHRDAWGGEDCFEHLQEYLQSPKQNRHILEFYDLILSLGFEGKFQMLEHGSVLLMDLRNRLHTLLYAQNATELLAIAQTTRGGPRRTDVKALKIFLYGLLICLCAYVVSIWYLHEQSSKIRSDILAWVPPEPRKINIMETLPNPLSQILNEGWLEVRKDPRGWLLIFTSDGAFRTGQAQLSEEFLNKRNIERLGEALAPWPGDLEVIGHTDNQPFRNSSGNSNLKLSEARAMVVADKLRESTNINQTHQREITAIGRGESEPLSDNNTEEGRRRNRRVDILWKIGKRDADQAMKPFVDSNIPELLDTNKQQ